MVPIDPDRTHPTEDAVDGLRDANRETLDAAGSGRMRIGLDEEMEVVALHRELQQAEPNRRSAGQGALDGREDAGRAERRGQRHGAKGDVDGTLRIVHLARTMRHVGTHRRRPATRARPAASMRADHEGELLRCTTHLD